MSGKSVFPPVWRFKALRLRTIVRLRIILDMQRIMSKNKTVIILHPIKRELRYRKWPDRMWRQIRKSWGIAQIRYGYGRIEDNSPFELSQLYQALYNIAKDNRCLIEGIEIARLTQVQSPKQTIATRILLFQKQQGCQVVLRTTWSNDDAVIRVTVPADLLNQILSFGNLQRVAP